ncbi:putative Alpha-mannosidase 2C1 [Glarea lozoyensis 74030]|uniref:alpha-mannosidase n=1 Tax=Glarea lozoyensis (strain ATCC 74030 / MF5533) TaxID=1104152 RepID=H0ETT1_GLAL7|nr:putative Alpha-mannosidase 2C1 [Glarea lozoyensis 74030]
MGGETFEIAKLKSSYPKLSAHPVGQWIPNIYKDRIGMFTGGGQYETKNLRAMLTEGSASGEPHVKLSVWDAPDLTRPTFKEATSHKFESTSVGSWFGPSWSTHWFKVQLTVPKELCKKELLELRWDANNEGMVWTEDGNPLQGLTGGGERTEWILPKKFRDGKEHTIYIEMACNGMFGNAPGGDSIQPPDPNKYFQLSKAEIVAVNVEARHLYIDMWEIGDAAREFPADSWEQHKALKIANDIIDAFELGNQDSILKGRKIAQEYLGKNSSSSKVYDSGTEPIVYGVGHCHIDTCWLWPWAETKRKVARSWSNQCDLMDRYPEHRFTCSQAQQYKWLKQYYPYVFDRVKEKVKKGTFQPVGGSWVEHDTNMPNGSQVICHMAPSETYTAEANFGDVRRSVTQHKSMDQDNTSLLVFGKGDGGGGPTWEHLEKLRRCRGMADTVGLLPRVHLGEGVEEFFDRLEKKASEGLDFVTWKSEIMLHDIEQLATLASIKSGYKYPKEDIDDMWEAVLLCQFHDCLPGSSIEMCYDDSDELYAKVFKTGEKIFKDLQSVLGVQDIISIGENRAGVACGEGNLLNIKTFKITETPEVTVEEVRKGVFVLQNDQLRVSVEDGYISSLYDRKAEREVVAKGGKANQLVIFDDKPLYWQAWDVEVYHLDSRKELSPGTTKIFQADAHQTYISLSAAFKGQQSYVEMHSEVEWQESMKFLKVEFPVDVRNTEASYETQYGVVRRPTHYNTTWDMAKFEVCCHKFADLSEHGYATFSNPIKLIGNPSLILDTIKRGEDDEDVSRGELPKRKGKSVVLRIYDSLGGTSKGTIETTLNVKKVYKTNILEDDEDEISISDGKIDITLRPFEVATFRLQL